MHKRSWATDSLCKIESLPLTASAAESLINESYYRLRPQESCPSYITNVSPTTLTIDRNWVQTFVSLFEATLPPFVRNAQLQDKPTETNPSISKTTVSTKIRHTYMQMKTRLFPTNKTSIDLNVSFSKPLALSSSYRGTALPLLNIRSSWSCAYPWFSSGGTSDQWRKAKQSNNIVVENTVLEKR